MDEVISVMYPSLSGKEIQDSSNILGANKGLLIVKPVITVSGENLGAVILEISLLRANQLANQALHKMLMIALATISVGFALSVWVAGRQISPLNQIRNATEDIANGDLSIRLNSKRNDEFGELAISVDKMTEQLQSTTVSKGYMDRIIQSMRDGLLILDENKTITKANTYITSLTETTEKKIKITTHLT